MRAVRANDALTQADVPGPDARWRAIETFALTFDGYKAFGNTLGPLAQRHLEAQTVPETLDELRGCLFFEQRRWRHVQAVPDAKAMRHIHALLAAIRAAL